MKILAIETTGNVASVAVVCENETVSEFTTNFKQNHSVTLMPLIAYMLEIVETKVSELDYIAVSTGPGSFTGLRIGAATAKALAHGANKQIIPVPTLDGLAYNIFEENALITPIMDARRDEVYCSLYSQNNGKLQQLMPYTADKFEVLLEEIGKTGKSAIFLGDGLFVYKERILESGHKMAPANMNLQRAASIGRLAVEYAEAGKAVHYNNLELLYLRKPQAEREYEEKNTHGRNTAL